MIILGLTGSIGMGKSTAAQMLKRLGCAIHDSDAAVHAALSPRGDAFEAVALNFPVAWDKKKHIIKRDVLGGIVFKDAAQKKKLEAILHPLVRADQKKFIQAQKRLGKKFVVLDIPLLFETGSESRVDYTVVVSAPYHIQARRVLARPNMSDEKFQAILAAQMSDGEKCKRADFIVPTGMGLSYTYRSLKNILEGLR